MSNWCLKIYSWIWVQSAFNEREFLSHCLIHGIQLIMSITFLAVRFMVKLMWRWSSEGLQITLFLLICLTRSLNLLEHSSSSCLLFCKEEANDVYRWDINLKIQGAPLPKHANFPISFCMLLTLNVLALLSQLLRRSLTCWMHSGMIPTIILLVSTT